MANQVKWRLGSSDVQENDSTNMTDLMGGDTFNSKWQWDRKPSQGAEYRDIWTKRPREQNYASQIRLPERWISLDTYSFPKTSCQCLETSNAINSLLWVETHWSIMEQLRIQRWPGSTRNDFSREAADITDNSTFCVIFQCPLFNPWMV